MEIITIYTDFYSASTYEWEETWQVDQFGNKLTMLSQTNKVITAADYSYQLVATNISFTETLASDGSYYRTRVVAQYREPFTGLVYQIDQPLYTYARNL